MRNPNHMASHFLFVSHLSFTSETLWSAHQPPDKSPVTPAEESVVHFLRHSRCAIGTVLTPSLLNRQIFLAGSYNQVPTPLRGWQCRLRHLTFRASSGLFPHHRRSLCQTTPIRCFWWTLHGFPHQQNVDSPSVHKMPKPVSERICQMTAKLLWSYSKGNGGLQRQFGTAPPWKASGALCASHGW